MALPIDFSIDDPEVFVEADKEFSMSDSINKLIEYKRCNTLTAINELQKGLIPTFLNISWYKSDTYFKNQRYEVSSFILETCISIQGLLNSGVFIDETMNRYFSENMMTAYSKGIVNPFLLFVNKRFIPWSKLNIVRSDNHVSVLISDFDKDIEITDVQILHIPFKVKYTEGSDEDPTKDILFRFDKHGCYSYDSYIFIYPDDKRISANLYSVSSNNIIDFDLEISYLQKITPSNIVIFDSLGNLDITSTKEVKVTNLLTIRPVNTPSNKYYISCVYSSESNKSEDNSTKFKNELFEKSVLQNNQYGRFEYSKIEKNFDFSHSDLIDYNTNITNSIDYVMSYDQNKIDSLFESIKPVNIVQYNISKMIARYNASVDGTITMNRDVCDGDGTDIFPVIFHNGMIPSYYKDLVYTQNTFTFKPKSDLYGINGFHHKDTFEIVYFRGVENKLFALDLTKKSNPDYLNITTCNIDRGDLVVYSACRGEENLFPLNYTIDSSNNIILNNDRYLEAQMYIGSRNQFIYEQFIPTETTNIIPISNKFRTAYSPKKYMIFVNGRYINDIFYRLLIPSLNNGKITERAIYTMKTINPGDRVDIFYCSVPKMRKINFSGDLMIHCITIKAVRDGQMEWKVPYPFKNYPRQKDSFFCIKGSVYLDKELYDLTQDGYMQFKEDLFYKNQDLIFVFPYYRPEWDMDGEINSSDLIDFVYLNTRVSSDTDTVSFTTDPINGDVTDKAMFHLFVHTTFIEPTRYDLVSPNTIKFNDGTNVKADTQVTMVVDSDSVSFTDSNIRIETVEVIVEEDKQVTFDIPKVDYYDSFFIIKNSVFINPDRYFINNEEGLLFTDDTDFFEKDDRLLFVFCKNKKDETDPDYRKHATTEYMYYRPTKNCTSFHLPTNYYHRLKLSKENTMLFINTTFMHPDRYDIVDNEVILTNNDDIFYKDKSIIIVIAYSRTNYKKKYPTIENRERIKFEAVDVVIENDGQSNFTIPYPNAPFKDLKFILTIGSTFIPATDYYSDNEIISLYDTSNIKKGRKLRFTFIHNNGFSYISKKEVSVKLSAGQTEVDIPSPYYKLLNLNNRMMVFYGRTYLDKERYIINNKDRKMLLLDFPIKDDSHPLTFVFFYNGSELNGMPAYVPESGYVCFMRKETINNFNKEMYMMFVNGRKVCKSELLDVSNTLKKINKDIERRFDLCVLNCAPTITELKEKYDTPSTWDNIVDSLTI